MKYKSNKNAVNLIILNLEIKRQELHEWGGVMRVWMWLPQHQQVTMCATTHAYVHLEACIVSLQLHICSAIEAQSMQSRYKHTQTPTQTQVQLLFSRAQAPAMQLDDDSFYEYSLSRLQWPFQSSKSKLKASASTSLFTEMWQKRPTSFGFELCFEFWKMSMQVQ